MPELKRKNKNLTRVTLTLFFLLVPLAMLLLTGSVFAATPSVGTITPVSGTSNPYQQVSFTTTYTDADGWQNIHYAVLLINNTAFGTNCFYGYYNQDTNLIYLRNDANNLWQGGFAPGSANVLENSYVKLNCALTKVSGTANTLSITWSITFKSSFTGLKYGYLMVIDDLGSSTGFLQKGSWRINTPPQLGSISPASGSSLPHQPVTFTTTYFDADGWQNLASSYLLINTYLSGSNCFYGYYNQNTNKFYLLKYDSENSWTWIGGYTPGSSYVLENSFVKLDCAKTTVSGTGNTLTINWNITFKNTFTGVKSTYLYLRDDAQSYASWLKKGDFCIFREPIAPP